jgi:hypothetical protein
MDLTVSPDFDAVACYVVCFVAGLIIAAIQVRKLFENAWLVWLYPQTWLLFLVYALVPPLLFWLLDRTGAINDTSLFAAVLVGLGYRQIFAGQSAIKAPSDISALWSPLVAWADRIKRRVLDRIQATDSEFRQWLVSHAANDTAKVEKLVDLAKGVSLNLGTFTSQLTALDNNKVALGDSNWQRKRAQAAVDEISVVPNYGKQLRNEKLITAFQYNWQAIGWRRSLAVALSLLLFAGIAWSGVSLLTSPDWRTRYYVWRIGKSNSTKLDQFRAREHLSAYLFDDERRDFALETICYQLRRPGHSMERLNLYLKVLVPHRLDEKISPRLPALLIESLRSDSVDARTRINSVLQSLAKETRPNAKIPENLVNWKPIDDEPAEQLELRIKEWGEFFAAPGAHSGSQSVHSTNPTDASGRFSATCGPPLLGDNLEQQSVPIELLRPGRIF